MKLELTRKIKTTKSNIGPLKVDGAFECYILERTDMLCPTGTFELELYNSPKHGKDTLQLRSVPGRSNIQIHIANFPHELLGCLAPGTSYVKDAVEHSGTATKALRAKVLPELKAGNKVTITIS